MTTAVDICNLALSALGTRSALSSLTEGSIEAQQCAINYANSRDSLLRLHPWSFARRQSTLGLLMAAAGTPENPTGTNPIPQIPWRYGYGYPPDCLKLRSILSYAASPPQAVRYIVSSDTDPAGNPIRVILTDQRQAVLIYTAQITAPDLWDNNFVDALVSDLAATLALPLTGDKTLAQGLRRQAAADLDLARLTDGNEGPVVLDTLPDWISARGFDDSASDRRWV